MRRWLLAVLLLLLAVLPVYTSGSCSQSASRTNSTTSTLTSSDQSGQCEHAATSSTTSERSGSIVVVYDNSTPVLKCERIQDHTDRCAFVRAACAERDGSGILPYLDIYYCRLALFPAILFIMAMLILLALLFLFLGAAAGDFFCPNLSTLSALFSLSENVTGLTFLALGNGAPDLFTTFSAMQQHKYNLALGELMGAASFIVTCVVGSVAVMTGFTVTRRPFLRDVGFFLGAMAVLLVVLGDGRITRGESVLLIGYYVVYVAAVVVSRVVYQRKKRARMLQFEADQDRRRLLIEEGGENALIEEAGRQMVGASGDVTSSPSGNGGANSSDHQMLGLESTTFAENQYGPWFFKYRTYAAKAHGRRRRSVPHVNSTALASSVSPPPQPSSLLSTLGIRRETAPASLAVAARNQTDAWRTMNHATALHIPEERPIGDIASSTGPVDDVVAIDDAMAWRFHATDEDGELLPLRIRRDSADHTNVDAALHLDSYLSGTAYATTDKPLPSPYAATSSPGLPQPFLQDSQFLPSPRRAIVPRLFRSIPRIDIIWPNVILFTDTFFPFLGNLSAITVPEIVGGLLSAPAVFVLTLTVPVVDLDKDGDLDKLRDIEREILLTRYGANGAAAVDTTIVDSSGNGTAAAAEHSPFFLESIERHLDYLYPPWQRWLLLLHCFTAPLFLLIAIGTPSPGITFIVLAVCTCLAALISISTTSTRRPRFYKLLCLAGFPTAVAWIYLIAHEVVSLLLALGLMLNVSEAMLGLTIFAIGNSIADFVANITVARMGYPNMAVAACFGGPMLNLLLGIGSSSFFYTFHNNRDYILTVTPTLITSACGLICALVISLVLIPWNGWKGTRLYGMTLIAVYGVVMLVNILVETFTKA